MFELCQRLAGVPLPDRHDRGHRLAGHPVRRHARSRSAQYLPRLATGELIASFALTEPEAGSDAASLRTTAIRDGDHYVVNGTKRFITNAPQAGIFTLMARTDPGGKGRGRHVGLHRRRRVRRA